MAGPLCHVYLCILSTYIPINIKRYVYISCICSVLVPLCLPPFSCVSCFVLPCVFSSLHLLFSSLLFSSLLFSSPLCSSLLCLCTVYLPLPRFLLVSVFSPCYSRWCCYLLVFCFWWVSCIFTCPLRLLFFLACLVIEL